MHLPVRSRAQPIISVIVPAFNEARTLAIVINALLAEGLLDQIIVVDDGSTDSTSAVLEAFRSTARVVITTHAYNRGKGAAIRTGLALANGRFCVVQDADLEYNPRDLVRLLQPLLAGKALAVFGIRMRPSLEIPERFWFALGVQVLNSLVRLLYGKRIQDEATCYKVLPTSLLRSLELRCQRFEFCPEVTAKLCRLKIPILELPIGYTPRLIAEGKKIRFWDALEAAWTLLYWRFAALPATASATVEDLRATVSAKATPSQEMSKSVSTESEVLS
jgi:glycosyltransferase involved in cell wall biosynthesis